jgi:hypothetical protein
MTNFKPWLQVLEDRTLLSTVNWIGGSGNWNDPTHWLDAMTMLNHVPTASDDAVIGLAGVTVTHGPLLTDSVRSVAVSDPSSLLAVVNGSLSTTSGVTVNGTLSLGSGGTLTFQGTQQLGGTGTVVFDPSSAGGALAISGSAGSTLSIAAGITIRGKSGSIGSDGYAFINRGTISADTSGGTITLNGTNWSNLGTIRSTAGGGLHLNGTNWTNTATIGADSGSSLWLSGSWSTTTSLDYHGSFLTLDGTWTNAVPLTVTGGSSVILEGSTWSNTNAINISNVFFVTLTGNWSNTGTINISSGVNINLDGHWTNQGTIGLEGATFAFTSIEFGHNATDTWSNQGAITVIPHYAVGLNLNGHFTTADLGNYDFTGCYVVLGGSLDNTGATLALNNGSTGLWSIQYGTLIGGTVAGTNGAALAFYSNNGTLNGVILNIDLDLTLDTRTARATLINGVTLNGTAKLGNDSGSTSGTLIFQDTQTLNGTGTVLFGASSSNGLSVTGAAGATVDVGPNVTVRGNSGTIGSSGYNIANEGTVSADVAGGTVQIQGGWTNRHLVQAAGDGSTILVTGGLTLDNGTVNVGSGSGSSSTAGKLLFQGTQRLAGTGTVIFGSNRANIIDVIGSPDDTLTIDPNITVRGENGSIGTPGCTTNFFNQGTIAADVSFGRIDLQGTWSNSGTFLARNNGTLYVHCPPTNYLSGTLKRGTWQVYDTATLRLKLGDSLGILNLAANVLMDGPFANFAADDTGLITPLDYLLDVAFGGILSIENGKQFTIADTVVSRATGAGFTNAGAVAVGSQSRLDVVPTDTQGRACVNVGTFASTGTVVMHGNFVNTSVVDLGPLGAFEFTSPLFGYTQIVGTTIADGGTGISVPAGVDIQGGALFGFGTINNDVTNRALVFVGFRNETHILTIAGDYTQTATGILLTKLNGTSPDSGYDRLVVGGTVSLAARSTLLASLGFSSTVGDSFTILTAAGGITGTFNGLPDNALFDVEGSTFRINYTANSIVLTHVASPVVHFALDVPPNVTAGTPFNVTVTAQDALGHTVTGYTGAVHFTASNGAVADHTFTAADMGTHTFNNVTVTRAQNLTVRAGDQATPAVGSVTLFVAPSPGARIQISVPATVTAGTPFNATVTILDPFGNTVVGYTGTVHFTVSLGGVAVASVDYPFTAADQGQHVFTRTLLRALTLTVTGTDTVVPTLTGSTAFTIAPAAADHLVFVQQPTGTMAGHTISPAVVVAVVDRYGNVETGDNTDMVTMSIGTDPSGGTAMLSGTIMLTVSGGVATFNDLSISMPGVGYTLRAHVGGGLPDLDSYAFTITM